MPDDPLTVILAQAQEGFLDQILGFLGLLAAAIQQPPQLCKKQLDIVHPITMARPRAAGNGCRGPAKNSVSTGAVF